MRKQLTIRISPEAYRRLEQLPGASLSEKAEKAFRDQQVTAAIAKAVAEEIHKAQQPTRELLAEVKLLRSDVSTLSNQSRITEQKAANATRAVAEMLPKVEARMQAREKALESKLAAASQMIAQKEERTQRFAQAVIDRLGANR